MRKRDEIAREFSPASALEGRRRFFLVGIGGAGMSALARMLKHRGFEVRGTDSTASPETARLESEGIRVTIGHRADGITREDALVVTDAIDLKSSPEVARSRELGCPMVRRSACLGWLLRDRKVIAVTGTHGKTTTTGMIGAGMIAAGMDPFVMVGANIPQWGGPVVEGGGEWAVVEACEAYDSFHDLRPHMVVLTNLELDHVDFHESYENLRESVACFVDQIPADGALVFCEQDPGAVDVAQTFGGRKIGYTGDGYDLSVPMVDGRPWSDFLRLPGRHNWTNANGAYTAIRALGGDAQRAMEQGIALFEGAERRLQVIRDGETTVVDDYAHHPTEIVASLSALRDRFPGRRLVVVYQPHLYSRTAPLIREFAEALSLADAVVLTDIYPAREDPIPGISSARIVEHVSKQVSYVPSRHLLPIEVAPMLRSGDVVVGMGAGNISEFAPNLVAELDRRSSPLAPLIAVLDGGDSAEREVSILSGRAVQAALDRLGYRSLRFDITDLLHTGRSLGFFLGPRRPDLAFLAVHGTNAEDGAVQGFLELLHIPYTGSGIQASALAMDKAMTKRILAAEGIPVPRGVLLSNPADPVDLEIPVIVKPNAQGSTVGLSFVDRREDLDHAIEYAFSFDSAVLVEEWVQGMEISTPVVDGEALLPVEIAPANGRYDFESKYTPGATEEIVPARLPAEVLERARDIAVRAHRALGCSGATRTDAIVRDGEIYVLELNTLPGMTATSLLPNSAAALGISFDELCRKLVEGALADAKARKTYTS